MDGFSTAASLVGIGTAGCQIAIKLYTLATQISTASDHITANSNDVSLTSGILQQLGELMTQKVASDGTSIFSQTGSEITRTSATICENIFNAIEQAIKDASELLRGKSRIAGRIKLSKSEKVKWPFLRPSIEALRSELPKGTLMFMLQLTSLASSKKLAETHTVSNQPTINAKAFWDPLRAERTKELEESLGKEEQKAVDGLRWEEELNNSLKGPSYDMASSRAMIIPNESEGVECRSHYSPDLQPSLDASQSPQTHAMSKPEQVLQLQPSMLLTYTDVDDDELVQTTANIGNRF
ncbi:MAG: hypothetical protein Q9170_001012 [Blastenia crenularia]